MTFDDETKIVEVEFDGKMTKLRSAILTVNCEPVKDRDAERKAGFTHRILKPGPVMEINLTGLVA